MSRIYHQSAWSQALIQAEWILMLTDYISIDLPQPGGMGVSTRSPVMNERSE